ncbi:putative FBD-associated F-box protein [Panicum miliaceum]|uniref:FBD-associated F-box protein n=1 Tax=Panicum miliaceum TaxID=4540 RepID=A0A3L6RHE7_PANMI|nr:putative FBD-associated F-box protein [Panicum miliaceum]
MPRKVSRLGEASSSCVHLGGGGDGGAGADRLSALPDALLHHVMSFMKAWDAARTCVLSRWWRDLWASAPCVNIRVGRYSCPLEDFAKFVYRLLLAREALAPVKTLRLRSPGANEEFDRYDVKMWTRHAIRRNARVIQLIGHPNWSAELDPKDFVSRHLKILKLSYTDVFDSFTRQLSSRCPSLKELEVKNCLVEGHEITSVSLKRLTMVKCAFTKNLLVDAPNLVSVQCITPEMWVPLFKNFGALITVMMMMMMMTTTTTTMMTTTTTTIHIPGLLVNMFLLLMTVMSTSNMFLTFQMIFVMSILMISRQIMIMEVISIVIMTLMNTVRLQITMKISSLEIVMMDMIALRAVNIMVAVESM